MPDPHGVRQAIRVPDSSRFHRLVEGVPEEVVAGLRLDRDEPALVLRLQHGVEFLDVDSLRAVDNRTRFRRDHDRTPSATAQLWRYTP